MNEVKFNYDNHNNKISTNYEDPLDDDDDDNDDNKHPLANPAEIVLLDGTDGKL